MAKTIRIGVIGAGNNTRNKHIPLLREQPDVEIAAVCNRTLASSRKVCEQMNIPHACEQPEEIFSDPQIDAVVIGTWPYTHAAFTIAALKAGKHVMCEARMAMNADEARQMLDTSRTRPRQVAQIVPAPFTLDVDQTIQQIVQQRLGSLRSVRLELITPPSDEKHPERTWRCNRTFSGNNIMSIGIWYETIMRWVGPVQSLTATLFTHKPLGRDPEIGEQVTIDVPDHVEAIGTMRAGGAFSLTASATSALPPGHRATITGSEGQLRYEQQQASWKLANDDDWQTIEPNPQQGWRVEEEFINAIRGREPIRLTDFETALAYMQFTDALHESDHLGQTVQVGGRTGV